MTARSTLASLAGLLRNQAPADVSGGRAISGVTSGVGAMMPAGQTRALSAMGDSASLFSIVDRIATSVASLEFRLYRKSVDGRRRYGPVEGNRVEVVHHPALVTWNRPNDFYTTSEFVEASQQHFELTGEWAWLVGRSESLGPDSMPLELWPVRPDRLLPVPHPRRFQTGWIYRSGGEEVPLRQNQVIHTRRPNPLDPYRGLSPVMAAMVDLWGEKAAAEWNARSFENGAQPGGLLQFEDTLEDDEFEETIERWNRQHRGVSNVNRVGIIERGKWIDRSHTRKDMEFLEGRRFSQESIRRAYGFPKAMLGDADDVNLANANAGATMFSQWLVIPRARRLRSTLNTQLLPLFGPLGDRVLFDFDDPTPPDREADRHDASAAVERAAALVALGVEPAEAFEHEGLPPFTIRPRQAIEAAGPEPELSTGGDTDGDGDTDAGGDRDDDRQPTGRVKLQRNGTRTHVGVSR